MTDPFREIEKMRPLLEKCLKYFNHVKGWSTHGPASISTEELAEEISAALNLVQPAQVEEVASPYRILEKGEIIQEGDEYDACSNSWKDKAIWKPAPLHLIGKPVSDPAFPAHTLYRRKKEKYSPPPTPTSAPALEKLIETLDELKYCEGADFYTSPEEVAEMIAAARKEAEGRGAGMDVGKLASEIVLRIDDRPKHISRVQVVESILSRHFTNTPPPPTITQDELEKIAEEAWRDADSANEQGVSPVSPILSALQRVVGKEKK